MDAVFATHDAEPAGEEVRLADFNERPHLVAPVVLVREGVLNGGYLPAAEIQASAPGWNAVPVTAPPSTDSSGHPTDDDGNFTSANTPEHFEQFVIGRTFNVEFNADINGLVGEMWLDIERARKVGDAAMETLRVVANGDRLEVSTGYWHAFEERTGTFQGDSFEQVQLDLLPDHLATLPNETGACSWADGCGAPRVNQLLDMEMADTSNTVDSAGSALESADQTLAERASHAVHLLTGQSCDCDHTNAVDETPTDPADTDSGSEPMSNTDSDDLDLDFEDLAERSAFGADELREDPELAAKVNETMATAAEAAADEESTVPATDGGEEVDPDDEEDETDDEPEPPDGADEGAEPENNAATADMAVDADGLDAKIEAMVDQRVEERLNAHQEEQNVDSHIETITAHSDYTEDELADREPGELALLAEGVGRADSGAAGTGVNYAGRGSAQSSTDDAAADYDVERVGALSALSAREEDD